MEEPDKKVDADADTIDTEGADESVVAEEHAVEAVRKLREKLKTCEAERLEYLTGWQRAKADNINAQKREVAERAEFLKFASQGLITEILPAMDSFHMAFGNKEAWEKVDLNWRMGVQYIYSQLLSVLERHGVTLLEPKVGDPFDPSQHTSVGTVPVLEKEKDHTVVEVVQKGYLLYSKVLEPARVKIGVFGDVPSP